MTSQTTPAVTDDDRRLACKWAEDIESATNSADLTPEEVEVAREWATSFLNGFYKTGHVHAAARALTALLPDTPFYRECMKAIDRLIKEQAEADQ